MILIIGVFCLGRISNRLKHKNLFWVDLIKLRYHYYLVCLDDRKDEIPSGNRLGSIIQEGPRRKSVDLLSKKSLPSVEDEPEPSEASSDEATLANSNYVDHNINDIIAAGTPGRKAVGLDFTTRSIISYSNHSNKVEYYHQPSVMSTNNSWQDSYQVCAGTFHRGHSHRGRLTHLENFQWYGVFRQFVFKHSPIVEKQYHG